MTEYGISTEFGDQEEQHFLARVTTIGGAPFYDRIAGPFETVEEVRQARDRLVQAEAMEDPRHE